MEHHLSIGTLSETEYQTIKRSTKGLEKMIDKEKKFTSIEHRKN